MHIALVYIEKKQKDNPPKDASKDTDICKPSLKTRQYNRKVVVEELFYSSRPAN